MTNHSPSRYKWYILALGTATHILVVALPRLCIPVLFEEISLDLGLNLVQIGTIWGLMALPSLFIAFAAGMLNDRFGTRLTLGTVCLLAGIAGALRGFAGSFTSLAVFMFVFGACTVPVSFATHRAAGQWFSGRELGMANSVLAMGIGAGTALGSMVSATVLSPFLGGWRNLMFIFGAISVLICFLWFRVKPVPARSESAQSTERVSYRQALTHVIRLKSVWMIIATTLFLTAARAGLIGYLPLHLRSAGWADVGADGALAMLSLLSVVGVIPLSLLSDKIGSRKTVVYPTILVTMAGMGLLAIFDNWVVWPAVIMVGTVQEAISAILITMTMEAEGVGKTYSGTALGLSWTFAGFGSFIGPPIGNSLAEIEPSFAFIFWTALVVISLFIFRFVKETGWKKRPPPAGSQAG